MSRLFFALLTILVLPKTGDPAGGGSVWVRSPQRARQRRHHYRVSPSVSFLPYCGGRYSGESAHAVGAIRSFDRRAVKFKMW